MVERACALNRITIAYIGEHVDRAPEVAIILTTVCQKPRRRLTAMGTFE